MASEARCRAVSEDGYRCILRADHVGAHQRTPCYGDCDNCLCDFVDETDLDDFDDDEEAGDDE